MKTQGFSLKQLVGTNLTTIVLMVLLTVALVSGAATINVYLDDLPATAYYTVKTDGTNTWCVRYDGYKPIEGTNTTTVINWALANLPSARVYQSKVLVQGNFTIDDPLIIYSYTEFELQGRIKLANNVNDNMIENANQATYNLYVWIHGGIWDGNKDQQSAGNIIDWECSTQPSTPYGRNMFTDMELHYADTYALSIDNYGASNIHYIVDNIRIKYAGTDGIYLGYVNDSVLNFHTDNGIHMDWCATNFFDCPYINNGLVMDDCTSNTFANGMSDNADNIAFDLEGCRLNRFLGMEIRIIDDGADVEAAIKMVSSASNNCTHNIFNSLTIGRIAGSGTREWTYAVLENTSNQNYNTYIGINAYDTISGIRIRGANSHANLCWNSTAWVG